MAEHPERQRICRQVTERPDAKEDKGQPDAAALTRTAVLDAADTPIMPLDVPEWGGRLYLRTMTGTERDAWETELVQAAAGTDQAARIPNLRRVALSLLVRTMCDHNGRCLFSEADIPEINKKSASVIDKVFEVAQHLNGLTEDDVEGLAKNSPSGRPGNSGSDSPSPPDAGRSPRPSAA